MEETRIWRMATKGLTLVALAVMPSAIHAESLRDALVGAYENSNILQQNRALVRSSDDDVALALSTLLPQINAISTIAYSDQASFNQAENLTSSIQLQLDLLLYDSGAARLGVEAAKETVLAARAQLLNLEQQVLLTAVSAYLSVLSDSRTVALRENNLRLITEELRAARDRFDVGEVTRTDVAQAEARLAEVRGDLAAAMGALQVSRELYNVAVGRFPGNLESIRALPEMPATVERARALAERLQPTIRQAQHQVKAADLTAAQARASIRPQINLNASAGHNSVNDNNTSIGLQMTVPIYQGGQLKALERRALSQAHAARANLHQVVLIAGQNAANAFADLRVAQAQLAASDRQIRAAQVAFDGVREEAKLGARTTLDVLDAEQALLDAQTARVLFETQLFAASYELLSTVGMLTATELNLPVTQYDPTEYYNAVKSTKVPASKQGKKLDRILKRYDN